MLLQDVLIAFMPFLKGESAEASRIHEDYQSGRIDQRAFLRAAREFLLVQATTQHAKSQQPLPLSTATVTAAAPPAPTPRQEEAAGYAAGSDHTPRPADLMAAMDHQHHHTSSGDGSLSIPHSDSGLDTLRSIEHGLDALLQDDSHLSSIGTAAVPVQASIWGAPPAHHHTLAPPPPGSAPSVPHTTPPRALAPSHADSTWQHSHPISGSSTSSPFSLTPPYHPTPPPGHPPGSPSLMLPPNPHSQSANLPPSTSSPWQHPGGLSPLLPSSHLSSIAATPPSVPPSMTLPPQVLGNGAALPTAISTSSYRSVAVLPTPPLQPMPPGLDAHPLATNEPGKRSIATATTTPPRAARHNDGGADANGAAAPTTPAAPQPPSKEAPPPPRRLWTRFEEQPGRITVGGCDGSDSSLALYYATRQELTAHWSLPLQYLSQHRPGCTSLDQALEGLTVGLFRRGCLENGSQSSIISKRVTRDDNRTYEYGLDSTKTVVCGKVPFYSPRTPGHVLFRLYWEAEPLYTLAMGPTLHIRVTERDFDSSIRFVLSNFKGKKSNPTSLSSLHSLAQVLETQISAPNESAARAVFGCIQEARKVVEACATEYLKTTSKLEALEATVDELKKQVEDEDAKSHDVSAIPDDDAVVAEVEEPGLLSEAASTLREKTKALMSGRASCERKWRDSQLSFASILRAVVTNQSMNILLRRDLINKMRLEYELWCPLCEEFAVPDESAKMWYEPLRDLNRGITPDDFLRFSQARGKMQVRTLGFEPSTSSLDEVLVPPNRGSTQGQRSMDPRVVNVFNVMSTAMGQYFQELYANEDRVAHQRQLIRERTEKCVLDCGAFPAGTRVVIFGSSANGFGSPQSDIDMCLQVPPGGSLTEGDTVGSAAMSTLSEYLEKGGMKNVDACRLTARIPVIKFYCPNPMNSSDDEDLTECDISMRNPLAVLNTALLRSYAEITPVTRVLAAIIKRWAKAREINNPARHTLSSYGYIIMLLHFMTYHKRTGNGLVSPVAPPEGDPRFRRQPGLQPRPLLPNLQWMDPVWTTEPPGSPYRNLPSLPRKIIAHPIEEGKSVNSYFFQPSHPKDILQTLFPGQDLSLAILLASFFRYYAYEFDYKRFVVSLHSTASRGLVEREEKAELDGWRHYSASLTVEDPFETFYDVAHVLRGGYYHRIRREFAVAYTKIADVSSGRASNAWKKDLAGMSGKDLIDWICEPVANERETEPPLPTPS